MSEMKQFSDFLKTPENVAGKFLKPFAPAGKVPAFP